MAASVAWQPPVPWRPDTMRLSSSSAMPGSAAKLAVHEQAGFRFDMGPTILTVPSVLGRIFAEAGRHARNWLVPLDPQWRCFFPDGTTLDLLADTERMAAALDAFAPGTHAGTGYRCFLDLSARLHAIAQRYFSGVRWAPSGIPLMPALPCSPPC